MPDLFELAKEKLRQNAQRKLELADTDQEQVASEGLLSEINKRHESCVLICGSANCGKTSLINRFLEKNEAPAKTIALEYNYSTRLRNNIKDLSNLWELGGGSFLANLLDVTITQKNLEQVIYPLQKSTFRITSLILFIDLTIPEDIHATVMPLMEVIRKKLDQIMREINDKQPSLYDKIMGKVNKRFEGHKDSKNIKPFPIPMVVMGAKYDEFQNYDTERKKTIIRLLRYFAHINGASLQMYSSNMENLVTRGKSVLSHFAYNTPLNLPNSTDPLKPVFVSTGSDSIDSIGPLSGSHGFINTYQEALEQWTYALNEDFPQKHADKNLPEDPTLDKQFAELEIDRIVDQRSRDLEMYIKEKRDRQAAAEKAQQKLAQ